MVNIDTVYQRVLAFANKEQRGYITPQEFNLYANQAQIEIYEQYHYDVNNFEMRDASYNLNSDTTVLTRQKLDFFITADGVLAVDAYTVSGNYRMLPEYVYRMSRVNVLNKHAEYVDTNRFTDIINSGPLVRPTPANPIYTVSDGGLRIHDGLDFVVDNISISYYRLPATASWGYFVIGNKALYDSSIIKTTHFEVHASDESELVYKILKFAGISMAKLDIMRAGQIQEQSQLQQEIQ